ncbi:hypothetical protein B0I12_002586 [Microbacterium hydrothermale]|nr:hypothetical protein [Microbacterium hydrothermale]
MQGGYYWPPSAPLEVTLEAFVVAYRSIGYRECQDGELEEGYEKVAIYADDSGNPTHASRQLPDGRWASKLGRSEDIEHDTAADIAGDEYGSVGLFMRRKIYDGRPHPRDH